ncbi:serine/threonine protein kinase [Pseudomonas oryzihabitans]|nr:serine/threonine protein kinase [Pseudomonas psychrotolerans]KTT50143.1 serine/threonine protein kinase [Pseudomonas psychrotolerans]
MTLEQLAQAGRVPTLPLRIDLPGGELELRSLLRVLPGQRYVGEALWQGRRVLAKLLVGDRAARQFAREREGCRLLAAAAAPTPALLESGEASGQGAWLLFDFIEAAPSVEQLWQDIAAQPPLSPAQNELLGAALATLARLHAQGLWQADLHLDNLLVKDGNVLVIDAADIQAETVGQPLSQARVQENLAVFFAQLPATLDEHLEELLIHYLLVNAEHALRLDALLARTAEIRRWRLADYLKKSGRECTLFAVTHSAFGLIAIRRRWLAILEGLIAEPDAALAGLPTFKDGGAATVARLQWQGQDLVLKRYNIKGFGHWLTRFWRPSRAWHSWREGHRLLFLGIPTPEPLAVRERRFLGLRGRAYLVTPYLAGPNLLERFAPYVDSAPPAAELDALLGLVDALRRERLGHGDFKGTNLIWHDDRWQVIDLDALQAHTSDQAYARAYARDRARLLRNWPVGSALYQLLDSRLPRA